MIRSLLRRNRPEPLPLPPPTGCVPEGIRVYAIGDIHGCADLFSNLLFQIEADDAARAPARTTIILLGDLVDRGPDSKGVIDRAIALKQAMPATRWLLGNHEEMFLMCLAGSRDVLPAFLRNGGDATLLSYGVSADAIERRDPAELAEVASALVPDSHRAFLEASEDLIVLGDYAFVHAGIRPGVPLRAQKANDLRWIRREFLEATGPLERIVVHGHSITSEVEERPNRIGIDTGAFASGRLTAMGFESTERWVLQTGGR